MALSTPSGTLKAGDVRSVVDRINYSIETVERVFAFISSLFIMALMFLGVSQIVSRKLFDSPIFGYIDLVELAMTTFAFLAISYTERQGGHVRMELLLKGLRGRALWTAELIGVLFALFAIAVLIYYSWEHAMRAYEYGDTTIDANLPWWPSKILVPIAFSVLWIRLLFSAFNFAYLIQYPSKSPHGVPIIHDVREQAAEEAQIAEATTSDKEGGR